ncbi:von Willebrand factor A domain-containing protein 5B2 [Labeo rohita]|uniref:von Willebrand factor A domain-containing protein 5B2 n=1 Tax=Labeo rohita TaxID=84645 RepID=A0ABQ8MYD0_LABRO|nr:von Willebrand factor A domain-containing protein 5B2 [Labeo rohita]
MPGLKNRTTWAPLLLKTSDITSCANGCSLGITAHLTYVNTDPEPVEGVFVYPLGEKEVVVGFEAVVSGRLVSVELQSRGKLEDCCLDCCPGSALHTQCGHLLLDEDLERNTFIVSTGQIGPLEIVSVVISTTLELPTLENGAIRLVYPTVLTPIVRARLQPGKSENGGKSEETSPTTCFGTVSGKQERMLGVGQQCTHALLTSTSTNLSSYQLSFQLLVRGACLLAGLESPTHALRADADPSAQSAYATYITLAEEHSCDRHLEIILHLSEPHSPLVTLERGRLTFSEYEQQIRARRDFIRFARKEAESEKRLEFIRRRYHKDLLLNPVLMLNFCPDLLSEPTELQQASRELIFLIDNSNTMTQHNINKIKEGMLVTIKSLPTRSMLNIAGICSTVRPLFSSSKPCTDSTVTQALEYIQKMRIDQGGANLWGALSWVYRQPVHRSCPRQLFILLDGTCSSVGRVLELVRRNACNVRCFGLGLGPQACRRLLQGVAKVTGGSTEFLSEEERLQPKLIKCLKKALEPVLTDVRIDWYVPDNVEALLSPNEIPPLYPGNCLIGYCTLYDVSGFRAQKTEVKPRPYRSRPRGSAGSVFEFSPSTSELLQPLVPPEERERDAVRECGVEGDFEEALREISREISSEFSCAHATDNAASPVRRPSHLFLPKQRALSWAWVLCRMAWREWSPHKAGKLLDESRRRQKALARSALAGRSFSSPQGDLDMHRLRRALEKVSFEQAIGGRLEESDTDTHSTSRGGLSHPSLTDSNGLLFPASPLDWDTFTDPECLFSAAPPGEFQASGAQCRSVIHGMLGGRAVSWEVRVDLSLLWDTESSAALQTSTGSWDEIIHQLTARSVIRDFENMAEKETDIEVERGPFRRYRMKAIQTSKSCGIVCMYTSFTTTDTNTRNQPQSTRHMGVQFGTRHSRRQKLCSVGLGRRPSSRARVTMKACFSGTGGSISPSAVSSRSQRSVESFFGSKAITENKLLSNLTVFLQRLTDTLETDSPDYLPLVRLQLASGAFLLSESYSECIQIPLDRLKRASPYLSHRSSLSPPFRCTSPPTMSTRHIRDSWSEPVEEGSPKLVGGVTQADSGRGSETDTCEGPLLDPAEPHGEELAQIDLGHSGGSSLAGAPMRWVFVEWELVAAKADFWLKCQTLPEGVDLAGLRAAARQLFLLLRHWDENIKLNVLCYNPNNM